ncbi:MAG: AbrB/MazE/SpoVT family DNA-binding domain-containing protein [Aigarchaeota archaeon]|nr:AbrB/MazE/SpoVT family DNA-binding domain-containing protein [Candidatus Caldarchaeales archaeon]
MEVRRAVQLTGGSSFTVTLPKEWVERMGLSKGSQVIISPAEDGGLHIYPDKPFSRRPSLVEIMLTEDLSQLLVGAYLWIRHHKNCLKNTHNRYMARDDKAGCPRVGWSGDS